MEEIRFIAWDRTLDVHITGTKRRRGVGLRIVEDEEKSVYSFVYPRRRAGDSIQSYVLKERKFHAALIQ
jgi:hypothetical protein